MKTTFVHDREVLLETTALRWVPDPGDEWWHDGQLYLVQNKIHHIETFPDPQCPIRNTWSCTGYTLELITQHSLHAFSGDPQ